MFSDIDTTVMDGEGRINAGMEGIIAIMRKAANAANTETTKISSAYKSLHADTIARNEAIAGLTDMAGFARSGDSVSVNSTFEALSAEAINAITTAMPSADSASKVLFTLTLSPLRAKPAMSVRDVYKRQALRPRAICLHMPMERSAQKSHGRQ